MSLKSSFIGFCIGCPFGGNYGGFIMLYKTTVFWMLNFHYARCFISIIDQQSCKYPQKTEAQSGKAITSPGVQNSKWQL